MAQSTSGDGDDSAQEARMKFIATVIRARDLKPGELFSVCGQAYWDEEVVEWLNQLRAMAMIPLKRRE